MNFDKVDSQYNGPLSPSEAADGINAALANARRLLDDALLLLANERWASAAALAILAMEERAKEPILQEIALVPKGEKTSHLWKLYRDHQYKNRGWIIPILAGKDPSASMEEHIQTIDDPGSLHRENLDRLKQACIYTDRLVGPKPYWDLPVQLAEAEARALLLLAENFVGTPHVVTDTQIAEMKAIAENGGDREAVEQFLLRHGWWHGDYKLWKDQDVE